MIKWILISCLFMIGGQRADAQGVHFVEGKFSEVKVLAKQENKSIMLYFKMEGGPCEQIENNVFADENLSSYFNEHFVCYAVDTKDNNTDLFVGYEVHVVPMIVLLDTKKIERYRIVHKINTELLLRLGQAVTGDAPTLEGMFAASKSSGYALSETQRLLEDAPYFLTMMPRDEAMKWLKKLSGIYQKYMGKKGFENMISAEDFNIIRNFNKNPGENDSIIEHMVANFDRWKEKVPEKYLVEYLVNAQNNVILNLAHSGNKDYTKALARVKGDMREIYKYVESDMGIDTMLQYQAGGIFVLFGNNNPDAYVRLKSEYFNLLGTHLSAEDLYNAVIELMSGVDGYLSEEAATVCSAWIDVVLGQKQISENVRVDMLIAKGDCCASIQDKGNAKSFYNEAYVIAIQMQDKEMQQHVKKKIERLDS